MLSLEQNALLTWLEQQPTALSKWQMGKANAPYFTRQRVEEMYRAKLLHRDIRVNPNGASYGIYSVSDYGKAALLEAKRAEQERNQKAKDKKAERSFQIRLSLFSAVVGSLLTLLVEHFDDLIDFIRNIVS